MCPAGIRKSQAWGRASHRAPTAALWRDLATQESTNYGYDADGNRTQDGSDAATYNARNQLVTSGTTSYGYTARGTLAERTDGSTTTTYTADAFDQLASAGATHYAYDGLGRLTTAGTANLGYDGLDTAPVSDGTQTFGRGLNDDLMSIGVNGTASLALADQHGDVIGQFSATGSALTGSTAYDPWGQPTANAGVAAAIGYQGDWTDPTTGDVNTPARWYSPATAGFTSQDTLTDDSSTSVAANRYAYGDDDPVTNNDPSGHRSVDPGGCLANLAGRPWEDLVQLLRFLRAGNQQQQPLWLWRHADQPDHRPIVPWHELLDSAVPGAWLRNPVHQHPAGAARCRPMAVDGSGSGRNPGRGSGGDSSGYGYRDPYRGPPDNDDPAPVVIDDHPINSRPIGQSRPPGDQVTPQPGTKGPGDFTGDQPVDTFTIGTPNDGTRPVSYELELRKAGWISDATWAVWLDGMRQQVHRWPFEPIWHRAAQGPGFELLKRTVVDGDDDPCDLGWWRRRIAGLGGSMSI